MKTNPIKVRPVLVMLLIVALVVIFFGRLVDIQVVEASTLSAEALDKRSIPQTVYSQRGQIVDTNGAVLADSVMRYNITASPKNVKEFLRKGDRADVVVTPQQAATEIGAITGQKPDEILKIIADALAADSNSDFVYVKKAVEVNDFRALQDLEIPWLFSEQAPGRSYPNGGVAGNLLGYVGQDGEPQAGLEYSSNDCVAGVNGEETYQRSADGVRIPGSTVTSVQAQNGGTLQLTIDSDLQWYAQQLIAKRVEQTQASWGIAVVQEVKTGKLRAVADYPTLDPNAVSATDAADRGSRAFMAPFEPGSTMKAVTASMLLDSGVATPASQVVVPYEIDFPNGAHVKDALPHGVEQLTLTGVLEQSSNVGITQLGEALAPDSRYAYQEKFGFGQPTSVGFTAESGGILNPVSNWDNQTYYNTMFGQAIATTAIQMTSAYQTLGNKGVRLPVSLIENCTKADGTVVTPDTSSGVRVVSDAAATTTVNMLENFVTQGWINPFVSIPGYRLAMKTGTAEQSDGQGGLSEDFVVSNLGLVPANDPQYVVYVVIAAPHSGASYMACPPVWKDLAAQVIKRYRIQPTNDESPFLETTW